jgi:hypothetical protein
MDAAGCGRGNALLPSMPEQTGENKNNVAHAATRASMLMPRTAGSGAGKRWPVYLEAS